MFGNKSRKLTAFLLTALLVFSLLPVSVFAADPVKLTVIHVNDRHGRTEAEPYISQMVKDLTAEGQNVLLLDAGDSLHGQTPTNLTKGETMVDLMNAVGYDVMTSGNHDFNFGVDRLKELTGMMDFPLLAANVKTADGKNLFESYKTFEYDGLKVGVFGLATPETVTKSDPRIVAGLTFEDPSKVAAEMVEALKAENCDVIIALAHLGVDEASAPKDRSDELAKVDGIDVIVDGHSHTALESGKTVGNTLIAQTGSFAENIGVVEIIVADGTVTKTAKLVAVPKADDESPSLAADSAIVEQIEKEKEKIEPITGVVVGNTPVLLQGEREYVRTVETNLANLVTDSMKYATDAEIAFLTGGNLRASIEAGDITMGDVLTTLPFANLLATVELSGKDMLLALEHGVAKYPEPAGEHIQVSGIKFEFDPSAEPMSRVTSVTMADGTPFDENKTYIVATIDFITSGGDGYDMMAKAGGKTYYQGDAEALAAYLATNPAISAEAEGRVTMKDVAPAEESAVEEPAVTEPAAPVAPVLEEQPAPVAVQAPATPPSGVYVVKPGDNLSKIANTYGTTWREIYKLNTDKISDPNMIFPDQELVLPAA